MKRISLLFCALVAMSTVMYGAKKKQPKQQLWPDGSVMSEWFSDTTKVDVETLGKKYVITEYDVGMDSTVVQTAKIQAVIDKAAQMGGGVVVVPKGTFLSGSLFFKQGTHLYIEEGGKLKGSERIADFEIKETRIEGQTCKYFTALVNADGIDGFTIAGKGTIDGNGYHYWNEFWIRRKWNPQCTNKDAQRPRLTYISNCKNVTIQDVRLINSPFWTNHIYKSDHARYLDLYIYAPTSGVKAPSSDAIDIDVCHDVMVHGCYMNVNDLADNGIFVANGKMLLAEKMVDGVKYADEMKAEVKKLLKLDADEKISQLSIADMATVKEEDTDGDDEIAVYYAYGDIVDTPAAGSLFSNSHAIVGNDVCKDLEELANDDDVKAVVIRINSGGGSAYASEQMWHQIDLLKKKKPVVISMGGMAASGGYYMSCNANYIFAEPTTLTGSIGIFGVIPNFSDLATNKLGLKFDEVKTNRNALFGSQARMMNEEEVTFLQGAITRGYHLFRQRVADGRKMTVDQVEQIAQGHVFTGEDALKIKLVDELGGLDKAVAKAAALAKTKSYYTQGYPASLDFFDQLLQESTDNGSYLDGKLKTSLGTLYEPMKMVNNITTMDRIQARMPWWLNLNN